jgi:hypothetical protein
LWALLEAEEHIYIKAEGYSGYMQGLGNTGMHPIIAH